MVRSGWRRWVKLGGLAAAIAAAAVIIPLGLVGSVAHAEVSENVAGDRASSDDAGGRAESGRGASRARRSASRPDPRRGFDLDALEVVDGRLVQRIDGRRIVTTLDPELQRFAEALLARYDVPDGAAVAINSRTGEVLAFAEHSTRSPGRHVALDARAPAASIFKVITAAALLDAAGLEPDLETCYHGGASGITEALLVPDPQRDRRCATLSTALGRSINVIFARLADQHLTGAQIEQYASAFGFGEEIDFDLPLEASRLEVPEDRLERARTAAGFWHSHISPLHAALLAQAVAQGGARLRPYIIDEVIDAEGHAIYDAAPEYLGRACSPETAARLARMMVTTTTIGTARSSFRDRQGRPVIPGVDVAGKTGTLHGRSPFRAYDWFMGFAPAEAPEIAVAGLVINDPEWRIKGHYVGAELLRRYFQLQRQRRAAASRD